jgi:hypothetical protein
MLFDSGNPYRGGPPQILRLAPDDFVCGFSPANKAALRQPAKWNVLVYMAADNSLAAAMYDNLTEMRTVGSTPSMHVSVLFDGPLLTDSFFARLNAGAALGDDIIVRYTELHTNAPGTLTLALRLSALFPAERHLVILSGHGRGWHGALLDDNLGMHYFQEPGALSVLGEQAADSYARLSACQLEVQRQIEQAGPPPALHLDILALDACYTGSIEAVQFFASQADTLVVSEDQEPAEGYPYARLLGQLRDHPDWSPAEVAAWLVGETKVFYDEPARKRRVTQVALKSAALEPLAGALVEVVEAATYEDAAELAVVRTAVEQPWRFASTDTIDLKGFVAKLLAHPREAARAAARRFLERFDASVVSAATQGIEDGTNGLSIYAPSPDAEFDVEYIELSMGLRFRLGAAWRKFLAGYYERVLGAKASSHPLVAFQAIPGLRQAGENPPTDGDRWVVRRV